MSFFSRVFLAWSAYFRILLDGAFAERVARAQLPEGSGTKSSTDPAEGVVAPVPATPMAKASSQPRGREALQLLALLQRTGRFVDFLEQDITTFSDADVGVAARVVHEGCRKALRTHVTVAPIRSEEEGARVTIEEVSPEISLVGNVSGSAPYRGKLEHRGWRAARIDLPEMTADHDAFILAPAEVAL